MHSLLQERCMEFYLVGGYVRDLLLEHPGRDVDFALAGDAMGLAREIADEFGGFFVPLDEERCIGRAILRDESGEPFYMDFARLRGGGIATDLALRDFTINAMAIDLSNPDQLRLIDPHNGRRDLEDKTIKAISDTAFEDDPLRTLRAVRLAAELDFHIEPKTEALI
ncbi:MAG: CCA tRNA nucleotidyltransferase, partial [Chloroflexota bacterium]|nr:CCA tRNA nucleotidyltransferase [Chloroflexota bacterium]